MISLKVPRCPDDFGFLTDRPQLIVNVIHISEPAGFFFYLVIWAAKEIIVVKSWSFGRPDGGAFIWAPIWVSGQQKPPHRGFLHTDDFRIDLLGEKDTDGTAHNDEGALLRQMFPSQGSHEDFECEGVTCTKCKYTFNVKGLEW